LAVKKGVDARDERGHDRIAAAGLSNRPAIIAR